MSHCDEQNKQNINLCCCTFINTRNQIYTDHIFLSNLF